MAFYKLNLETQEIEESQHVSGVGYDLSEQSKDEYVLPVDGWIWAENLESAKAILGVKAVGTISADNHF